MVQGDNRGMLNTYAYIQILRNIIILIPCSVNPLRRFLACRPLIWFLYGLWFLVGCLVVCCFLSPPPPTVYTAIGGWTGCGRNPRVFVISYHSLQGLRCWTSMLALSTFNYGAGINKFRRITINNWTLKSDIDYDIELHHPAMMTNICWSLFISKWNSNILFDQRVTILTVICWSALSRVGAK